MGKLLGNSFIYCFYKVKCVQITILRDIIGVVNTNCQIFSHFSILNTLNSCSFKVMTEFLKFRNIVEFSPMKKSSCPSENASNRVCRCFKAFLVLSIMPCNSSMSCLSLNSSVRCKKNRSH